MIVIDMNMPLRCVDCCIYELDDDCCQLASFGVPGRYGLGDLAERPEWCPLSAYNYLNGKRMLDADELMKRIRDKGSQLKNVDTINGLAGALAIVYDMLHESGQEIK